MFDIHIIIKLFTPIIFKYVLWFFSFQDQCFPQIYVPMLHQEHVDDLRHFRVKSKSWAAGDKPRHRSRLSKSAGSSLRLTFWFNNGQQLIKLAIGIPGVDWMHATN